MRLTSGLSGYNSELPMNFCRRDELSPSVAETCPDSRLMHPVFPGSMHSVHSAEAALGNHTLSDKTVVKYNISQDSPFENLPDEIILNMFIVGGFSPKELSVLALVNKKFKQMSDDNMLWKSLLIRECAGFSGDGFAYGGFASAVEKRERSGKSTNVNYKFIAKYILKAHYQAIESLQFAQECINETKRHGQLLIEAAERMRQQLQIEVPENL